MKVRLGKDGGAGLRRLATVFGFSAMAAVSVATFPTDAQSIVNRARKALRLAKGAGELSINKEEEIALGTAISEKIRLRYGVVQNHDATRYLTLVGLGVAESSSRPDLPYKWIILDSDAINAFAVPGGLVHVTRGALAVIRSEAELAGVLAHEIAHVTEKHTIKALKKSKGLDLAQSESGLAAGSLLLEQLTARATDAILAGFGRAEEVEADGVGVGTATDTGYHPNGLVEFLETLRAHSSGASSGRSLFRSHPETNERIAKLEATIQRKDGAPDVRLEDRYLRWIDFEVSDSEAQASAVDGARGVAGSEEKPAADVSGGKKKKRRFSLAKVRNTFSGDREQKTAEVTGSGGARAVGDEDNEEADGTPRNPAIVPIEVTPQELEAFQREGGLG